MICPDTSWDHHQCGLASSSNSYRFGQAEIHFRRAVELVEAKGLSGEQLSGELANLLIAYASLLVKLGRPYEAVAMYERRLALKRYPNEDRLERRCTAEHLASLKEELASAGKAE